MPNTVDITRNDALTPTFASSVESSLIRSIAFWATTFVVVSELIAGSVWNLMQIEWVRIQFSHLGYPAYFSYILGVWHVLGAAAIIVPGFPRLKEWAYAGCFFLWSSAVASHLLRGDYTPVSVWLTPLIFLMFGIASWALRPADRRLPEMWLRQDRLADAEQDREAGPPKTRVRPWALPIGLLVVLYVISFLMLPAVEGVFHERAVRLGWIER